MAYSNFELETLRRDFNLKQARQNLFNDVTPISPTSWLIETLTLSRKLIIDSEKARGELMVMPILLASRQVSQDRFAIYSGHSLNVDKEKGLVGECDFILTHTMPLPSLQSPIMTMVEAKKEDVEGGIGQCAAQMLGARIFNQLDNSPIETIFGCVTTGEVWQFLKLDEDIICVDQERYYINQLEQILGIFKTITEFYDSKIL
jgi:hypothetical protein